eukprot:1196120-Prorocentrum_minimum.AAC.3
MQLQRVNFQLQRINFQLQRVNLQLQRVNLQLQRVNLQTCFMGATLAGSPDVLLRDASHTCFSCVRSSACARNRRSRLGADWIGVICTRRPLSLLGL